MSYFIPFAQRTGWMLKSNKLSNDLERLRREKVPILDLTESNPTRCDFVFPKDEIIMSLRKDANLHYALNWLNELLKNFPEHP